MKQIFTLCLLAFLGTTTLKAQTNTYYSWAKQLGSTGVEQNRDITIDSSGNVYTVGYFGGGSITSPNLTNNGSNDIVFAKYDATGVLQWAKSIGSETSEVGLGIAIDKSNNVYITGLFSGTTDFDPSSNTANLTTAGEQDIFFGKYDANGNFLWAKKVGGTSNGDVSNDVAVDANGNVYITGAFFGTSDFDPSSSTANLTSSGFGDIFFAKYDANGNYVWAKKIGGTSADVGYSLLLDASNNIYLSGNFTNTADFDPSASIANLTSSGSTDVFFAKYDLNGNYVWAKKVDCLGFDVSWGMALDINKNIYITGQFTGTADFDPSANTVNLISSGILSDVFFAKYDANGNYVWAKKMGAANVDDIGYGITIDTSSNVYVTGYFQGTTDFDPSTATANLTSTGTTDVFFAKYDGSGNYIWAKKIGSTSNDGSYRIALDANNNVYIIGYFQGTTDFDPSSNTFNLTSNGGQDAFVAKYSPTIACISTSSTFTVNACNSYTWAAKGNKVYTANNNIDTITLKNVAGCDSVVTLNLTVKSNSSSTTNLSICPSQLPYSWNGNRTTAGTYTFTTTNIKGCDSVATLNLTIKASTSSTTSHTTTSSYTWNGVTYTTSGIYTKTGLTNAIGCDSSAILNLTINTPLLQAPSISYGLGPQVFAVNAQINFIYSVNTGGVVPEINYRQVSTFAGDGTPGAVNDSGILASFNSPIGIAIDGNGNSYIADQEYHLIRKISPKGIVTTLAGSSSQGATNATGTAASFSFPTSVAVDASGNVYVADQSNHLIRKITSAGVVTTLAGSGLPSSTNGTGTAASFNYPTSVAVDASGNVYVADQSNHLIRKITSAGVVTTFAGSGSQGAANGTGTAASFNFPQGLAIDASGNLYVADLGNNKIRKITSAGVVTTFAGTGIAGSENGANAIASFNFPYSVAVDALGNVYVGDGNPLIRKITTAGIVTTLAGSGIIGDLDDIGTGARFGNKLGVAVGKDGDIYVADGTNNKIRKISQSGYTISPALPDGLGFDGTIGGIGGTPAVSSPATNYTVTAYNAAGSSSTTINIAVVASCSATTGTFSITACNSYYWVAKGNKVYTQSNNTDTIMLKNATGCDSIVTLNLTIIIPISQQIDTSICSGVAYGTGDGNTYYNTFNQSGGIGLILMNSGTYFTTIKSSYSCDSVYVMVNLTVRPVLTATVDTSICNGSFYRTGNAYYTDTGFTSVGIEDIYNAGTYYTKTNNTNGCDVYTTLHLTIKQASSSTTSLSITSSQLPYYWNGLTFTAAGTKTKTGLTNAAGCDSAATLVLSVTISCSPTSSTNGISICPNALPYSWNGSRSTAGTYTFTTTNSQGCDSVATLNLTVKTTSTSTTNVNICPSALPYSWNGSRTTAGTYTFTTTNSQGCDSVATLNLTVKTTSTSTTNVSICPSQLPYSWNGSRTVAGTYTFTLTNSQGCDSVATLVLTVKATSTSTSTVNVCANQLPYSWNGLTFNAAGSKTVTLTNSVGCDSVATLNLTVGSPVTPSISISNANSIICSGNNVTFNAAVTNGGASPIYNWKKNNSIVGTGASITFLAGTLATADTISCVLTANNPCQTTAIVTSNKIFITVNARPIVGAITNYKLGGAISAKSMCAIGDTLYLANYTATGVWTSSNSTNASVTTLPFGNGSVNYVLAKQAGTATISYIVTAASGCISSSSVAITVAPITAPAAITGASAVCVGIPIALSTVSTGGVWSSSAPAYASVNASGIVTGRSAGLLTIRYTLTNAAGCSAFNNKAITVYASPATPNIGYKAPFSNPQQGAPYQGFCVGKVFGVSGTPSNGVWSAGGCISVTTAGIATINTTGLGSLTYIYTNSNGCASSRTMIGTGYICAAKGVVANNEKLETKNDFSIFPNPAKSIVNLKVETLIGEGQIIVTDLYGKSVKSQPLSMGNNTVNITNLSKGFYLISTITSEGKTTKKLIVE